MNESPTTRRGFLHAAAGALGLAATSGIVSGCSSGQTGAQISAQGSTIMDRAPVASDAEVAATPTAAAIKQRRQMLIGGDLNMPLLSQQNPSTGQTTGFDADLGRMLAKYIIGEPLTEIVSVDPETRESLLQVGTVDAVIRIYTITPERATKVSFAGPYLSAGVSIATLKTENGITTPDDLNGKSVVTIGGSTSEIAVKKYAPHAKIIDVNQVSDCVQALEQGAAVAYVHDLTTLAGAAQLNNKIKVIGQPFSTELEGIGIRHNDNSFKAFVNRWLQQIEDQGLWKDAWQQSLGTVLSGGAPTPPKIGSVPGT